MHKKAMFINPRRLLEKASGGRGGGGGRRRKQQQQLAPPASPKGHFAAYTRDGRRFAIPIAYLNSSLLRELLKMSEEEFGVAGDGPIMLPCDAALMEDLMAMLRRPKRCNNNNNNNNNI